ncbi:MAG TPA: hypothetical protein VNS12_07855 [Pelagibacterium sp.]|uniref:hypothetical protein n=1 Tax=Pelagibacterium sp. TaxID=1967288 RepID=UPI002B7F182A|nr:hypothetical protein [Pelagibacterium sp.]HWJ87967.1 hypothetical protein [Pelagibacterium sp.]
MFDLSFLQIVSRAIGAIIVLSFMGFAVALTARALGDKGPVYDRKLTLNPFVHVDPLGFLASIPVRTGWIRPIQIDPASCKGGRVAPVIVGLVALLAVFALGRILPLALPWVATSWPTSSAAFVDATIRMTADIAAWTIALNLLPFPPLIGGYLLQAVAPSAHAWMVKRHFYISIALAAVLILAHRTPALSVLGDTARLLGAR